MSKKTQYGGRSLGPSHTGAQSGARQVSPCSHSCSNIDSTLTSAPLFHRIENTLPGRDSFEIEIYGMAGIPEKDLAEWKERRSAQKADGTVSTQNKRPRIEKLVLSKEQLRIQLEAHKALMSGRAPMPGLVPGGMPGFGAAGPYSVPPPALPPGFGVPPPNFARPPPNQPPPGYGGPPPGVAPQTAPRQAPQSDSQAATQGREDGREPHKIRAADLF